MLTPVGEDRQCLKRFSLEDFFYFQSHLQFHQNTQNEKYQFSFYYPRIKHSRLTRYLKITSYTPCFGRFRSFNTILNCFKLRYPAGGAKKDQVERLGLFLSIAKAMVYHHALACISSPKVYIISRRLYFTFAMMMYKAFRFDDMQFLAELTIYTPQA